MPKTITAHKFVAGEDVACYFNEVVTFGEVIAADDEKVIVSITHNIYPKHGGREIGVTLYDYVCRESDGLFVSASSVAQRVPSQMIVRPADMGAANQWRYWPSPIEKLKRKFSK